MLESNVRSIIDSVNQPMALVNVDSEVIWCNRYCANLMGYKTPEETRGMMYEDQRCPAAECAEDFRTQDNLVIETKKPLKFFCMHQYYDGEFHSYIGHKFPCSVDNKLTVSSDYMEVTSFLNPVLTETLSSLATSMKITGKPNQFWFELSEIKTSSVLTKRETHCLYYLARGYPHKVIANLLNISERTVETHIENIKYKANCTAKWDIVRAAVKAGLIPISALLFL